MFISDLIPSPNLKSFSQSLKSNPESPNFKNPYWNRKFPL